MIQNLNVFVCQLIFSFLDPIEQWALASTCHMFQEIGSIYKAKWLPYLKMNKCKFQDWNHFHQLGGKLSSRVIRCLCRRDYDSDYRYYQPEYEIGWLINDPKTPKRFFFGLIDILDQIRLKEGEKSADFNAELFFHAAIQTFRPRLLLSLIQRSGFASKHWANNRGTYCHVGTYTFIHFWKEMIRQKPLKKRACQCFRILVRHWMMYRDSNVTEIHRALMSCWKVFQQQNPNLPPEDLEQAISITLNRNVFKELKPINF